MVQRALRTGLWAALLLVVREQGSKRLSRSLFFGFEAV